MHLPFDEIWFSDKYTELRRRLEATDRNHGICKKCSNYIPAHLGLLEEFHCAMHGTGEETPCEVALRYLPMLADKQSTA